jgi:hypothetical protein
MGATYSQNAKTLPEYYDAVRGRVPGHAGLALTRDDLVRRAVIMAMMCQGRVEFESIELAHLVKMREYFAAELAASAHGRRRARRVTTNRHPGHGHGLVLRARRGHDSSTSTCRPTRCGSASRASSSLMEPPCIASALALGLAGAPHCVAMCAAPCAAVTGRAAGADGRVST